MASQISVRATWSIMIPDCCVVISGRPLAACSWPIVTRRQPSKLNTRVRFPQSTLDHSFGDRLTVGRLALNQAMEVRFLLPELADNYSGAAAAGSGAWL